MTVLINAKRNTKMIDVGENSDGTAEKRGVTCPMAVSALKDDKGETRLRKRNRGKALR